MLSITKVWYRPEPYLTSNFSQAGTIRSEFKKARRVLFYYSSIDDLVALKFTSTYPARADCYCFGKDMMKSGQAMDEVMTNAKTLIQSITDADIKLDEWFIWNFKHKYIVTRDMFVDYFEPRTSNLHLCVDVHDNETGPFWLENPTDVERNNFIAYVYAKLKMLRPFPIQSGYLTDWSENGKRVFYYLLQGFTGVNFSNFKSINGPWTPTSFMFEDGRPQAFVPDRYEIPENNLKSLLKLASSIVYKKPEKKETVFSPSLTYLVEFGTDLFGDRIGDNISFDVDIYHNVYSKVHWTPRDKTLWVTLNKFGDRNEEQVSEELGVPAEQIIITNEPPKPVTETI